MKVLLAFDSFKGCLTAREACRAAAEAVREVLPQAQTIELPLSDGGEGLVACVRDRLPARVVEVKAHGPLMAPLVAEYLISADGTTAYMEMAATSGLTLVPADERDPMQATTYGVGEMILDAEQRGCRRIVMGIGGSATCDGGMGMLEALTAQGQPLPTCEVTVACDVTNPLYGPEGAAYVFAPQKGATPEQVQQLDHRLRAIARSAEEVGVASPELAHRPGTGAAGGLGYGLLAYLHAELRSGIDIILDLSDFDAHLRDADLVITGEGCSDSQTLMGKVPHGVLMRCRSRSVPCWLLSGAVSDPDGQLSSHFDRVASINEGDDRPLAVLMQKEVALANLRQSIAKHLTDNKS